MLITGLYAALLALLALWLAARVVWRRNKARVGIGNGGDQDLAMRRRAHGNLLEYAPLALILLLLLELDHMTVWVLHLLGIVLVVARLLHAWGLSHSAGTSFGRFAGTLLTWLVMLTMIALLLWQQALAWMT
mgnify:CR=1 FL=1